MGLYFCLIVAMVSTFLWFNVMFADLINTLNQHYFTGDRGEHFEEDKSKLKIILSIISGIFWATIIYYM